VNEIYRSLLQQKSQIDSCLASLESTTDPPEISTQQRISYLLKEFSRELGTLRDLVKQLEPKSRIIWETRLSRFNEDLAMMRTVCDRRLGLWFRSQREQEERDVLFGTSNKRGPGDQQSQLLAEASSLKSSHGMMDAITDQSRAILDGILGQNATLKNARGKLYDLINNAGMGQSLANSIHSRERADALILYACMCVTLLIFLLLWWFVK
jgi:hypothetical protein